MTGLLLLLLLVAALAASLELQHHHSGERQLRRQHVRGRPSSAGWWPAGPVVRRS